MTKEKFIPHKNAPAPVRLEMERADNSGTVNADLIIMADRLAVTNHVMANGVSVPIQAPAAFSTTARVSTPTSGTRHTL